MISSVRLLDDASGRETSLFVLDEFRQDLILQGLEAPFPAVRAVVADRPDADGTVDTTARFGARAVTVALKVFDDEQAALVDDLLSWMAPAGRPYLQVADTTWVGERRLRLRGDQATSPMVAVDAGNYVSRDVTLQWQAPDGVWEAADPVSLTVSAVGGTSTGITLPASFPITFAATTGIGQTMHTNPGTVASDQRVRMYGPCAGPRWSNDATGETIAFTTDLTVAAGEYVEVDTRAHTAFYLSDPNADRLNLLDFEATTWWRIPPGQSQLRYHPTSGVDAGCAAAVTYRPSYL